MSLVSKPAYLSRTWWPTPTSRSERAAILKMERSRPPVEKAVAKVQKQLAGVKGAYRIEADRVVRDSIGLPPETIVRVWAERSNKDLMAIDDSRVDGYRVNVYLWPKNCESNVWGDLAEFAQGYGFGDKTLTVAEVKTLFSNAQRYGFTKTEKKALRESWQAYLRDVREGSERRPSGVVRAEFERLAKKHKIPAAS